MHIELTYSSRVILNKTEPSSQGLLSFQCFKVFKFVLQNGDIAPLYRAVKTFLL